MNHHTGITTLFILRHGEYEPTNVLPYRLPGFHLSAVGTAQAESLGKELQKFSVTAIYTSPLERTYETAEHIGNIRALPVTSDDRLLEVRSPVQGKTDAWLNTMGGLRIYDSDWYNNQHGETIQEIADRMNSFTRDTVQKHRGKTVVAVSHGDPIMIFSASLSKIPLIPSDLMRVPYVEKGTGYKIEFDEGNNPVTISNLSC